MQVHRVPAPGASLVVCGDVGSTFTKLTVVDVDGGALIATAAHPTTVGTDVLHGLKAATTAVAAALPGADLSRVRLCSSAGGGLRLAVVGYESLVTAEAGQRVGLSAGARVVHVAAGRLNTAALGELRAARPDVILLVGGTDGGDADVLRHNAARLASARVRMPVVVAGNADVRDEIEASLVSHGVRTVVTDNVLPRIGVLNPMPARAAIRHVFLSHVIGGKKLSRGRWEGRRFVELVYGPTPDLVLTGVEMLADDLSVDLVVVDIGGATTDVYSVLTPDPEQSTGPRAEVAGTLWRSRTVEGDLGMRWSASGVVSAATAERLLHPRQVEDAPLGDDRAFVDDVALAAAAERRVADPDLIAPTDMERAVDRRIAELAATIALRRHARGEPGGAPRKDLRDVRLVIGSGGVLRHATDEVARAILAAPLHDVGGGWPLPRDAVTIVDTAYVLAAAGLLASDFPEASRQLLRTQLRNVVTRSR
ncbi:MAG TPA: glutamate mutase L [Micromonosporaceae bacterium]|nr:glutamate mutase L [Micromonosporaceae bacterium]